MKKKQIAVTLGVVCLVLTYAIGIQLKTIDAANSAVSSRFSNSELKDEILKWKERTDELYVQLENSEKQLDEIRKKASENDTTLSNASEEIKLNNALLGLTDVTGKGIIITLKDNPNVTLESVLNPNYYIVHDNDIKMVINELKNAGAEAISVNGERIVQTTVVTCVGNVILVNDKRLSSPYEIKAIGLPESLVGINMLGGYVDTELKPYISVDIKKSNNITIPKYSGVISSKYLEKAEEKR